MADQPKLLDTYEISARLAPGFLVLLPLIVLGLAVGLRYNVVVVGLLGVFSLIGLPIVIANLVRAAGKGIEERLWNSWGGPPTTTLLRLAGHNNDAVRNTRRATIAKVTGLLLPSEQEDAEQPDASNGAYESAIRRLITITRGKPGFELVHKENQAYGFWRNLLGIRTYGRVSGTSSAIIGVALVLLRLARGLGPALVDICVGFALILILLAFWWFIPSSDRARQAATAYAERLLDSAILVDG